VVRRRNTNTQYSNAGGEHDSYCAFPPIKIAQKWKGSDPRDLGPCNSQGGCPLPSRRPISAPDLENAREPPG
jgi:hypothetical protein